MCTFVYSEMEIMTVITITISQCTRVAVTVVYDSTYPASKSVSKVIF